MDRLPKMGRWAHLIRDVANGKRKNLVTVVVGATVWNLGMESMEGRIVWVWLESGNLHYGRKLIGHSLLPCFFWVPDIYLFTFSVIVKISLHGLLWV